MLHGIYSSGSYQREELQQAKQANKWQSELFSEDWWAILSEFPKLDLTARHKAAGLAYGTPIKLSENN